MPSLFISQLRSLAVLGAVAVVLSACNGMANPNDADEEEETPPVPVEIALVDRADVYASYTGTTTLEAEREADIVAKTSGIILELLVDEGDRVEADQVVARLDRERLALSVQQARATLSKLENDFVRTEELFEKRLISKDAYDKARFDLESQRASVDMVELDLSYTEVRSPIAGVISERLVKPGKLVALHEALYRVDDFDPLLAILFVPERELNTLKTGQEAVLTFDAVTGEKFTGELQRVSPVIDPRTGTFKVTVEIADPDPRLKPGMFGRVEIVHDVRSDVVAVPVEALIVEDRGSYVFVADDDNVAHKIDIATGYQTAGKVEVLGGLEPGQKVVTSGKGTLSEEARIEIIEAAL